MSTPRDSSLAVAVAVLASALSAAPPPGKGGGKGDSGNSCLSLGTDTDNDDSFIEGSRTGLFLHEAVIANPGPTTRFGVSIDAQLTGSGSILAAIVSKGPGTVDLYDIAPASASAVQTHSVTIPGLEDSGLNAAAALLIDADGDTTLDLLVTHGQLQQGWIFLGPDYEDSVGQYLTLTPDADAGDFGGAKGADSILRDGLLYVAASQADVNGGPRGAVFVCDLNGVAGPGDVSCVRQSTPDGSYDTFGRGMTLAYDGSPKLLIAAAGAGKGKKRTPDRIFVYGHDGAQFDFSAPERTMSPGAKLAAFDYRGATTRDEVFSLEFGGPGVEFIDAREPASELPFDSNLQQQYATTISAGSLGGSKSVLLVNGPGEPDNCSGGVNDGYVYLYVFDSLAQTGPSADPPETLQSPTSDGADFGWDVAVTSTPLVLVGERRANGDQGRVHIYSYQP